MSSDQVVLSFVSERQVVSYCCQAMVVAVVATDWVAEGVLATARG